jgi:tetratricopeptide (TPR) repeat protein
MRQIILFFCCVFFFIYPVCCQNTARVEFDHAISALNFEKAAKQIDYEYDKTVQIFLQHHLDLCRYLYTREINAQSFFLNSQKHLAEIQTRKVDAWQQSLVFEMYVGRALVRFQEQEYTAAISEVRQAQQMRKMLLKKSPPHFSKRAEGLIEIIFSSVPKQYKWIAELLGMSGNLEKGFSLLEQASKHSELLTRETQLILFFLEKSIQNDPIKAWNRMDSLVTAIPENPFFKYCLAVNALDRKNHAEALHLLQELIQNQSLKNFPPLYYQFANTLLYKNDFTQAQWYFLQFIAKSKSPQNKSDAWFKAGICALFLGNEAEAKNNFEKCIQSTKSGQEKDNYAKKISQKFLQKLPDGLDLELWRARYQSDGGLFNSALEILHALKMKENTMNSDQKTEWYYRYGRIYQEKSDIKLAKLYYNLCIQQKAIQNNWMRAYSCFYLGVLFEQQSSFAEARRYYNQALSYDQYDFQAGLEQKAKAALERIKNK